MRAYSTYGGRCGSCARMWGGMMGAGTALLPISPPDAALAVRLRARVRPAVWGCVGGSVGGDTYYHSQPRKQEVVNAPWREWCAAAASAQSPSSDRERPISAPSAAVMPVRPGDMGMAAAAGAGAAGAGASVGAAMLLERRRRRVEVVTPTVGVACCYWFRLTSSNGVRLLAPTQCLISLFYWYRYHASASFNFTLLVLVPPLATTLQSPNCLPPHCLPPNYLSLFPSLSTPTNHLTAPHPHSHPSLTLLSPLSTP